MFWRNIKNFLSSDLADMIKNISGIYGNKEKDKQCSLITKTGHGTTSKGFSTIRLTIKVKSNNNSVPI